MNKTRFRLACAALAISFCSTAIADAVDAGNPDGNHSATQAQGADASGKPADTAGQPAATANVDAAGQPGSGASKRDVAKPARAKKLARKKAARKARKERKKAAKARRAAEAAKKEEARKAAASGAAPSSRKSSTTSGKGGTGKNATAGRPRVIQSAKIAAPGPRVIGMKAVTECRLQFLLPSAVAERSRDLVLADRPTGNVLALKITDVDAPAGGFLSGSKGITVEGRLSEGARVTGTFTAKETSMGAVDSCGMLEKAVAELARDIEVWLEHPSMNSKLGDAR